jgi:cytochrome P450
MSLIRPIRRTVVYANAHAMAHDERIYREPHEFNPDRYEPRANGGPGEPFPVGNFGFGRRYVGIWKQLLKG